MHIVNVLNQAVCLFVTLLIVLSLWSSVTGKRSHLVTQTHRIVNTAKTKAEWHAAALASDFKTLPIQNFEGDDRDEYGHLTFAAYCDALETRGKDPEWPLRSPHDTSDGLDGLGFESPAELCASMTSLPIDSRYTPSPFPRLSPGGTPSRSSPPPLTAATTSRATSWKTCSANLSPL